MNIVESVNLIRNNQESRELISIHSAIFKTIQSIETTDQGIILNFVDQTFTILKAEFDENDGYAWLHSLTTLTLLEKVKYGIISKQEFDNTLQQRALKQKQEQEEKERIAYINFHIKYENDPLVTKCQDCEKDRISDSLYCEYHKEFHKLISTR